MKTEAYTLKPDFFIRKSEICVSKVHNMEVKTDGKTQKYKSLKPVLTTHYLTTEAEKRPKNAQK